MSEKVDVSGEVRRLAKDGKPRHSATDCSRFIQSHQCRTVMNTRETKKISKYLDIVLNILSVKLSYRQRRNVKVQLFSDLILSKLRGRSQLELRLL